MISVELNEEGIFTAVFFPYLFTGEDAPISELVDVIVAAQIAGKAVNCANHLDKERNEVRL